MTTPDTELSAAAPRLTPAVPPYSEAVNEWMLRIMPEGVPPLTLFRALAVNERVFLRVMAGGLLDKGSITLREREIVIARVTWRCRSEYEWGVHVAFFGDRAHLTPAEIEGLCTDDPGMTVFPDKEKLLLRLCDELHSTADVSDGLWNELRAHWSPAQLIELVVLAGLYHVISFATNALRLPLEPFGARFPVRIAQPRPRRLPKPEMKVSRAAGSTGLVK